MGYSAASRSTPRDTGSPAYASKTYGNSFPGLSPAGSTPSNEVVSAIIRTGAAQVGGEGFMIPFMPWPKKWLVLTVNELQIFKSEVSDWKLTPQALHLTICSKHHPQHLFVSWPK